MNKEEDKNYIAVYKTVKKIMAELVIEKTSENTTQKFMFRGIDDVYNAINPLMCKHGLVCHASLVELDTSDYKTKSGTLMRRSVVTMLFQFVDVETGNGFTVKYPGEACDSGDKSISKAMAIAHKYAFLQTFCIPTEERNDPDFTSHEPGYSAEATAEQIKYVDLFLENISKSKESIEALKKLKESLQEEKSGPFYKSMLKLCSTSILSRQIIINESIMVSLREAKTPEDLNSWREVNREQAKLLSPDQKNIMKQEYKVFADKQSLEE